MCEIGATTALATDLLRDRLDEITGANLVCVVLRYAGGESNLAVVYRAQNDNGVLIDGFTFFVPYPTEILDDQFDAGYGEANLIGVDIETTISIAVHRSGAVVFYDQWEDGLEPNLTAPVQATSQVWGDGDPANGIPPGFSADVLNSGAVIILRNIVELDDTGRRDPSQLFFDGGDALIRDFVIGLGGIAEVEIRSSGVTNRLIGNLKGYQLLHLKFI